MRVVVAGVQTPAARLALVEVVAVALGCLVQVEPQLLAQRILAVAVAAGQIVALEEMVVQEWSLLVMRALKKAQVAQ